MPAACCRKSLVLQHPPQGRFSASRERSPSTQDRTCRQLARIGCSSRGAVALNAELLLLLLLQQKASPLISSGKDRPAASASCSSKYAARDTGEDGTIHSSAVCLSVSLRPIVASAPCRISKSTSSGRPVNIAACRGESTLSSMLPVLLLLLLVLL